MQSARPADCGVPCKVRPPYACIYTMRRQRAARRRSAREQGDRSASAETKKALELVVGLWVVWAAAEPEHFDQRAAVQVAVENAARMLAIA